MTHPGRPTAFEELVDDYDGARPRCPDELVEALAPSGRVLELGAGTGIATAGLAARAEALPFADGCFDLVCGAQMWHWVDVAAAVPEVVRVLRDGGRLAVWWNEVDGADLPWWSAQQERLEAANPRYTRTYRSQDHGAALLDTGRFSSVERWSTSWRRQLDWPLYERWLRSKSYVQAVDDLDAFLSAEHDSLSAAFPDGRIAEPFTTTLWVLRAG